jgi:hypothetical protein
MSKFRTNWASFFRHFVPWFIAPPVPPMPPTRFIVTIWKSSQLSDGWEEQVRCFDAVSIKAVDKENFHEIESARDLSDKVRSSGGVVHAWGFHDCVDWNDAVREARTAVKAVKDLNAVAYHWNAEKEWSESSNPPWFGAVFAREFKKELPDVLLFANCFRSPVDAEMISYFDQYEPMLYGTRSSTISTKFDREFARTDLVDEKMSVMVGTGRLEDGRNTRAWGYLKDVHASPGLASLVSSHQPRWVNFFRAGKISGHDMLTGGNDINPSLPEQVRAIKTQLGAGIG